MDDLRRQRSPRVMFQRAVIDLDLIPTGLAVADEKPR